MKKFRNDNDEDDFEDTEVKATSAKQPEKDNRRLIKIILNIIFNYSYYKSWTWSI